VGAMGREVDEGAVGEIFEKTQRLRKHQDKFKHKAS